MGFVFAMVKGANQFPVAVMNGHGRRQPLRRVSVARNVSEHRTTIHDFATQGFAEIDAVNSQNSQGQVKFGGTGE